jgi:hypothetical protein
MKRIGTSPFRQHGRHHPRLMQRLDSGLPAFLAGVRQAQTIQPGARSVDHDRIVPLELLSDVALRCRFG